MITKTQKNALKKFIKGNYSEEVSEILESLDMTNKQGVAYSKTYIIMVFNGHRNNEEIEDAIYQLAAQKKLKQINRKAILNTKKPEAATSGN